MSRLATESKNQKRALWIRSNIVQINIINIVGTYFSPTQEGLLGAILFCGGIIAMYNAFNKSLNVTFLNKGHAIICFITGTVTAYIGGMLIYVTIFS